MSNALDSPRGTIEHAKEHIAELESLVRVFLESHPYKIIREMYRGDPGHGHFCLRFSKPLPRRLRCIAGDAANNLRAALDQLGYAAARADGKNGDDAHFPFGDDSVSKRYADGKGRSIDIPKPIFDLMRTFKPYKGGNETLWRLNELANTMKHEVLLEATILATSLEIESPGARLSVGTRNSTDDKIILAYIYPGNDYTNHKFKVAPTIRFSDIGDATFNVSAVAFLHECSRVVEGILVRVEREARRIGII